MEVLAAILGDLAAQAPDQIAVTGDLVNVALPGEFVSARAFLERLGSPDRVSLVPGNHDAYVRAAFSYARDHWGDYMRGDREAALDGSRSATFPYLRRRGPLALIGVSTAIPTGPFMATGQIGADQLTRLDRLLAQLAGENERPFRVIMLHHPPMLLPGDRLKRLIDAEPFRRLVVRHRAELVLHGHSHVHSMHWLGEAGREVPVAGVPSASATERGEDRAAYNLFRVEQAEEGWRCEMLTRGFSDGHSGITELHRRVLTPHVQ